MSVEGIDAVAVAIGSDTDDGLYRALKDNLDPLYRIGDCLAPPGPGASPLLPRAAPA